MGGGRGLGGEQAPELFQQLQAALAEKETQEIEGDERDTQGQDNQSPSFEACISNIGLWLQISQICSQGLQESIAEARTAFPALGVLGELIGPRGPFSQQALLSSPSALETSVAEAAPQTAQAHPEDVQQESDMIRTLMEFIKTQQEQSQAMPSQPGQDLSAPQPTLPHDQLLQHFFASAPINSAWNAHFTAPDQLPAALSAPSAGTSRAGPSAAAAAAIANAQMQREYTNLMKRQRVGNPTDHHTIATTSLAHGHLAAMAAGYQQERRCSNCGACNTPFWRKDRNSKLSLCNACGLYAAKNDHPRPFRLWKEGQNVEHLYAAEAAAAAGQNGQATALKNNNNIVTTGTNYTQYAAEHVHTLERTIITGNNGDGDDKIGCKDGGSGNTDLKNNNSGAGGKDADEAIAGAMETSANAEQTTTQEKEDTKGMT